MPEIEKVPGRRRWDPLVDVDQPLMTNKLTSGHPSQVAEGDVDKLDTAPPVRTVETSI